MEGHGYYVIEVNHIEVSRASVRMVSLVAMSSSHDAAISHKGEKKRNYDMSFKLEATEYAERVSNNAAAKKYKLSIAELKEKHKGQVNAVSIRWLVNIINPRRWWDEMKRLSGAKTKGGDLISQINVSSLISPRQSRLTLLFLSSWISTGWKSRSHTFP